MMNLDVLYLDDGFVFEIQNLKYAGFMPTWSITYTGERTFGAPILQGASILCGTMYHDLTEYITLELVASKNSFISISDSIYNNQWYIHNDQDLKVMLNELSLLLGLEKANES